MASLLRTIRELHGMSIDELAAAIGYRKGTLSVAERFGVAGPKLRKKLEQHYELPWATLSHQIDGAKLASAITAQLVKQKEVKPNVRSSKPRKSR